jgi:hypothetical protein
MWYVIYELKLEMNFVEVYENQFLMVFSSYNQAMLLYNELEKSGCNVKLISTPCGLSRGCSQSIIFHIEDTRTVIDIVKNNNIKVSQIYKIVKKDNKLSYVPVQRA